jgi:hypothetical protein
MIHFPYGNSRVAIRLEQILNETEALDSKAKGHRTKVGSIVTDCNVVLKELEYIKDKRVFEMMWQSWYTEMMRRVDNCNIPKLIYTHLRGTIQVLLKNKRREYLVSHNGVGRKRRQNLADTLQKHSERFEKFKRQEGI